MAFYAGMLPLPSVVHWKRHSKPSVPAHHSCLVHHYRAGMSIMVCDQVDHFTHKHIYYHGRTTGHHTLVLVIVDKIAPIIKFFFLEGTIHLASFKMTPVRATPSCSLHHHVTGLPCGIAAPSPHSACTNGHFGRIYIRKFLSYAENRHQRRPQTSKIVSVCPDSKSMSYIPISFRMINSCQNIYIICSS